MLPGGWTTFRPEYVYGFALTAFALSWLLALALAPLRLGDVLLAGLGLALFLTAVRFSVMLCFFGLPLSVAGLRGLSRVRTAWWSHALGARPALAAAGCVVFAGANLVWLIADTDRHHPLFATGLPAATFPLRGAAVLGRLPAGSAVYTPSMPAGGTLGFLSDGRLRVSLDSRVPLHFDDAEYGSHRDSEQTPDALARYFQRFGFGAALVPRNTGVCRLVASAMRLVSVDAQQATFVTGAGSALPGIDPCSPDHLPLQCGDAPALAASVRRLRAQRDDVYARWLETLSKLSCGQQTPREALAAMPEPRALNAVRDAVVRWRVRALWQASDQHAALAALQRELSARDMRAFSVLGELWSERQPVRELIALYRRSVRDADDFTPPRERQRLAVLCLAQGDLECAYVQALRSAVLGDPVAPRLLEIVAQRHPREHVRKSLRAWLTVFAAPPRRAAHAP
jgi:hypothetical protein